MYGKNIYIIDVLVNNLSYPVRMKLVNAKTVINIGFNPNCNIFICDALKYEGVKKYLK